MSSAGWLVAPHRDKSRTWVSEEVKAGLSSGSNQDTWRRLIMLSGMYVQTWGIWLLLCIGDFPLNFYKFSDSPKILIVLKTLSLKILQNFYGAVIFHVKRGKKEHEHENKWILFNLKSWNEDSLKTPNGTLRKMIHKAIFVWVLHVINDRISKMTFFQGLRDWPNDLKWWERRWGDSRKPTSISARVHIHTRTYKHSAYGCWK